MDTDLTFRRALGIVAAAVLLFGRPAPVAAKIGITTTHMRPGYLRRNGVPHSATRC